MEIKQTGSRAHGKGSAQYFTGLVRIDPFFGTAEPARVRAGNNLI